MRSSATRPSLMRRGGVSSAWAITTSTSALAMARKGGATPRHSTRSLVAAAGSQVPEALKEQLVIGGRLLIPVGEQDGEQMLRKATRTADQQFYELDLDAV